MVLRHNSCLFLSQALWPPQTYRAYLSIGHYWPRSHMRPLDCIMISSRRQSSLSAPLRQLSDLEGAREPRSSVRCIKRRFTSTHSDGQTRLSKHASGSSRRIYTCPYCAADSRLAENVVSCAARVLVSGKRFSRRTGRVSQGYVFPDPTLPVTHTHTHTHT